LRASWRFSCVTTPIRIILYNDLNRSIDECQAIYTLAKLKRKRAIDITKLKVLELFAGTRSISRAFERRGHETFAIEWDDVHPNIEWQADIRYITAQDILDRFGKPDVIWASP